MKKHTLPQNIANKGLANDPRLELERWFLDKAIVDLTIAAACPRHPPRGALTYEVIDPETGQPYPVE
jgi:hypothetical protein